MGCLRVLRSPLPAGINCRAQICLVQSVTMVYKILCIFIAVFACAANAVTLDRINFQGLDHQSVKYSGKLIHVTEHEDRLGKHIILFSRKEAPSAIEKDPSRMESFYLFVTSYKATASEWQVEWNVWDGLDCPGLDSDAFFLEKSIVLLDADRDGVNELYIPYSYYECGGGLDSIVTKVIMRSGSKKMAARGRPKIVFNNEVSGGTLKLDSDLMLPENKLIKDVVMKIWKKVGVVRYP